jgi:rod shape-determining protein MreC
VVLSIVVIYLPNARREDLSRVVRSTVLRPILALQRGAVDRNAWFEDPTRLRAQRDSLAAFLVGQATLSAENKHLRELLGLHERLPPSFVPAEIVRVPGPGSEGSFQLTAGTGQGVQPGSTIVAAEGLVGRVNTVDQNVAFGIDWLNDNFRAAAMTTEGDIYGIVQPRTVDGESLLVLTGTPRHVELPEGTLIVTSGHGGVFPPGIPIGRVVGPEGSEEDWQRNYLIRPLVSPSEMTYVLVLGDPQRSLNGQDLALSWGIRPAEQPVVEEGFIASQNAAVARADSASRPRTRSPTSTQTGPPLLGDPVRPPQ